MEQVGSELRAAREGRNISIGKVAEETRIAVRHLLSLEAGRFGDLPGGMYNRAYLRSYCEYLGVDSAKMLELYEAESAAAEEKAPKITGAIPKAAEPGRLVEPIVVWSLMFLVSVAGIYIARSWIGAIFSPYFSSPPAERPPLGNQSPGQGAIADRAIPASKIQQPVAEAATSADEKSPEPLRVPPSPSRGTMRLQFQVLEKCWASVNIDGNRVLVKLMEPGDDLSFEAAERFFVVLGNAGGVRVKLDGKPAKRLGAPGEVVRVLISRQNIEDFLEDKPHR